MTRRMLAHSRGRSLLGGVLLLLSGPRLLMSEPTTAATTAFDRYVQTVETRLVQQHRSPGSFLVGVGTDAAATEAHLRQGELIIEDLTPPGTEDIDGAMLHHWRGTAFAPGATAADFDRLMRDFRSYPQHFAPQVLKAGIASQSGDHVRAWMRVRQHHVITVVMDTDYDVRFGQLDARHGYSISESTRVTEIDNAGTPRERALTPSEEHGFLWRLNTYWSYEERDGGLYLQVEAVSLTRAVPRGLGWAIGPYVKSIPRESLEFTLQSARAALKK